MNTKDIKFIEKYLKKEKDGILITYLPSNNSLLIILNKDLEKLISFKIFEMKKIELKFKENTKTIYLKNNHKELIEKSKNYMITDIFNIKKKNGLYFNFPIEQNTFFTNKED